MQSLAKLQFRLARLAPSSLGINRGLGEIPTHLGYRYSFATQRPDSGSDTHDDFKPQYRAGSQGTDVEALIKNDISTHPVFIYMKGTPDGPQCGFSNLAIRVLQAYGVQFASRNVLADPAVREGIKQYTSWPTIPQIFINGEFIGGSDILLNLHQSGELEKILEPVMKKE